MSPRCRSSQISESSPNDLRLPSAEKWHMKYEQMRKQIVISLLTFVLALCSCGRNKKVTESYLPLVKQALTDTSSVAWHLLDGYEQNSISGCIGLIGDFDPLCSLVSDFLRSDRFDNIDGREIPDELHDFAGETLCPVFDAANSPYGGYIDAGNIPAMREAAVSMALASLGRVSYTNMFDDELTAARSPAKVLIVGSPYLCRYALRDIDTMLVAKGIDIPVLSLTDEMFRRAGERHRGGVIAVLADAAELEYGLYREVYDRVRGNSETFPAYVEHPDSGKDSRTSLTAFLDSYIASGAPAKISAVLVGTSSDALNVRDLSAALEQIRGTQGLDMENYRSVLADDFEFISGEDAVIRACYNVLRRRNLFTHRIAYPSVKAFVTVPSADANIQVTRVVPLGRLYMDGDRLEEVNRLVAPMILNVGSKEKVRGE